MINELETKENKIQAKDKIEPRPILICVSVVEKTFQSRTKQSIQKVSINV